MKWTIVTDSSCEYTGADTECLSFQQVPFTISVGEKDFVDDHTLCLTDMMDAVERDLENSRSSCPSPGVWYDAFMRADASIAITISSALSGSYSSAMAARNMVLEQHPEKKIHVLDSLSTSSGAILLVQRAEELIREGVLFEELVDVLQKYFEHLRTFFALRSFKNLIRNGRMKRSTGFLASKLGIWGLGTASRHGEVAVVGISRGTKRAISSIVEDMKDNGFRCGRVVVTHCQNSEVATTLKEKISEVWEKASVMVLPTGGLCSYYAERGGLIVAYEHNME